LATEKELSDFLKSVEKRAFKRSIYHVRNEESALDIVQDSMLKLSEHYGDKPPASCPCCFSAFCRTARWTGSSPEDAQCAVFSMADFDGQCRRWRRI
jgi:RNA polymerase sigma-70 factor (ECF subfamily)